MRRQINLKLSLTDKNWNWKYDIFKLRLNVPKAKLSIFPWNIYFKNTSCVSFLFRCFFGWDFALSSRMIGHQCDNNIFIKCDTLWKAPDWSMNRCRHGCKEITYANEVESIDQNEWWTIHHPRSEQCHYRCYKGCNICSGNLALVI